MSGSSKTVVFGCFSSTEYQVLEPVAESLSEVMDIEFLLFHSFIDETSDHRNSGIKSTEISFSTVDATDYVTYDAFMALPASISLPRAGLQRFLVDNVTPRIGYEVGRLLRDLDPNLFVSAVDQQPFLRHIIRAAHDRSFPTATIQHGLYEYALDPDKIQNRPLFPDLSSSSPIELLKRRIGFRYGITEYAHPYTDLVTTFGDFFTERITQLRSGYPCFGKTDVVTTGSPEFSGSIEPYGSKVDSLLFLSQQQYEGGVWNWEHQQRVVDRLVELDDQVPVTVRPHPKNAEKVVENMAEHLSLSRNDDLATDIAAHDAVATINSTALFEAAIQGKVCCVLQFPWHRIDFSPFTHDHVVQIESADISLETQATRRSVETQQDYLDYFCYLPGEDTESTADDSSELIVRQLQQLL